MFIKVLGILLRLFSEVFRRKADYFILATTSEKTIQLTTASLHHFCYFFKTFESSQVEDTVQINNSLEEYKETSTSRARLMSLAMTTALFLNTRT